MENLVLVIVLTGIITGIIYLVISYSNRQQFEQTQANFAKALDDKKEKYDTALKMANLPKGQLSTVTHIEHIAGLLYAHWSYYIWQADECLCMFPASIHCSVNAALNLSVDKYKITRIPLSRILCYRQIGDVYTTVSGSGGHSSFSPLTGFHGKINPIEIKSEVHNDKNTQLFYDDGISDRVMVFKDTDFYTFKKVIPAKDYQVITIKTATTGLKQEDEIQRLEKINKLLQSGLISEEDYQKKKNEILKSI